MAESFMKKSQLIMDFKLICRVCLKEGSMKSIFSTRKSDGERKVSCSDMLMSCATVTVSQEDGLPGHICSPCLKNLWSAYKFRQLCEKSFSCLLNYAPKPSMGEVKIEKVDDVQTIDPSEVLRAIKLERDLTNEDLPNGDCIKSEDLLLEDHKPFIQDVFDNINDSDNSDNDFLVPPNSEYIRKSKKEKKQKKKIKLEKKRLLRERLVAEDKPRHIKGKGFPCSFCPKIFDKRYRLVTHQDFHMGIKRYYCDICRKSYRSEIDHKGMHKRGLKFKCEICTKFFTTKAKLTIHMETHNENREKIICGLNGCTKVFMTLGGVQRHRSYHDGLKNFICHLCSKGFIDKYLLEIHIRSHNNDRRYPCSYCDKRFIQSSARVAHERRHTNTKNYHCNQCEKSFVCSSVLKRHLLCHNKSQHESCRFCGKKFSRLDNRKRHEAVMHGVTDNVDEKMIS